MHILLVTQNSNAFEPLIETLKHQQVEVFCVSSPREAKMSFESAQFDICLIDFFENDIELDQLFQDFLDFRNINKQPLGLLGLLNEVDQKKIFDLFRIGIDDVMIRSDAHQSILVRLFSLTNKIKQCHFQQMQLEDLSNRASHDLKEPLRKIKMFSKILSEDHSDLLTESMSVAVSKMCRATDRLNLLVGDILDYVSLFSQRILLERIDLRDLVSQILCDFEELIEIKQAQIHVGDLPSLKADLSGMKKMFYCLIDNALKYSQENSQLVIEISVQHSEDRKETQISIKDNGMGFDLEYKDRVFEPFYRLVSKIQYPGSGLGLAVVKQVVEAHRGRIEVKSEPNKGTEFVLTLPLRE